MSVRAADLSLAAALLEGAGIPFRGAAARAGGPIDGGGASDAAAADGESSTTPPGAATLALARRLAVMSTQRREAVERLARGPLAQVRSSGAVAPASPQPPLHAPSPGNSRALRAGGRASLGDDDAAAAGDALEFVARRGRPAWDGTSTPTAESPSRAAAAPPPPPPPQRASRSSSPQQQLPPPPLQARYLARSAAPSASASPTAAVTALTAEQLVTEVLQRLAASAPPPTDADLHVATAASDGAAALRRPQSRQAGLAFAAAVALAQTPVGSARRGPAVDAVPADNAGFCDESFGEGLAGWAGLGASSARTPSAAASPAVNAVPASERPASAALAPAAAASTDAAAGAALAAAVADVASLRQALQAAQAQVQSQTQLLAEHGRLLAEQRALLETQAQELAQLRVAVLLAPPPPPPPQPQLGAGALAAAMPTADGDTSARAAPSAPLSARASSARAGEGVLASRGAPDDDVAFGVVASPQVAHVGIPREGSAAVAVAAAVSVPPRAAAPSPRVLSSEWPREEDAAESRAPSPSPPAAPPSLPGLPSDDAAAVTSSSPSSSPPPPPPLPSLAALLAEETAALHLERLRAFAAAVAPAMLPSLEAAWARYGAEPARLWATLARRFPGAVPAFIGDIPERAAERAAARLAAMQAAAAAAAASPPASARSDAAAEDASAAAARRWAGATAQYVALGTALPPAADSSGSSSGGRGGGGSAPPTSTLRRGVSAAAIAAVAARVDSDGRALVRVASRWALDAAPSPGGSGGASPSGAAAATAAPLPFALRLPAHLTRPGVAAACVALPAATFVAAAASAAVGESSAGRELSHPDDAVAVFDISLYAPVALSSPGAGGGGGGVSRGLPPLPSLRAARRLLRQLPPSVAATLGFIRHARPPHPLLVVALGVLCVLLGVPTTWRSALAATSKPQELIAAALRLGAGGSSGGGGGGGGEDVEAGRPDSPLELLAVDGELPRDELPRSRGEGGDGSGGEEEEEEEEEKEEGGGAGEDVPPPPSSLVLSLARKLLNKRPDMRAEARCLRLSIAPAPAGAAGTRIDAAPFAALIALVEWEVAFVAHFTLRQRRARELAPRRSR